MQEAHSLFDILALSFGNAALIALGLVAEPGSSTPHRDLDAASYNIELLSMLQEKTKGNLSPSEIELLESLLYDLRLKYVEAKRQA